ncbi:cytochrome c1 [Magnetovibrio sp. PR-2]|uniref:cytochrome c1 n=1 Tax=Magnetovibrio sp. PR-2 TaxID=3120356 RepID=UPI002FCE51E1
MRKLFIAATVGLALGLSATSATAAGGAVKPVDIDWSWEGMFGTFDREDVKKGGQIFFEVCNGCHSMDMVAYRNLVDIGWTEDEAKELAAEYEVTDGPDDEGEMFERPARLSDRIVAPYPNDKAAAAANGAVPPDLSVMTKARKGGPDYLYSLLVGYKDEAPEGVSIPEGLNYNEYFPGHAIAMAQPLYGESVEFPDGTEVSLEEEAKLITTFLAWAAEPELEERKALGLKVLLYLIILTAMLYALKHRIWSRVCLDEYTHGPYESQYQADLDKQKKL